MDDCYENMNVLDRINSEYYVLTASEKKSADFILSNLETAQYMSLAELAKACRVAEATTSRFCRRLGYKNFNDFKLALSKANVLSGVIENPLTGEILPDEPIENVFQKLYSAEIISISQTMELLSPQAVQEAVAVLKKAKRVLCMGQGSSMLVANDAATLFSMVSTKFVAVADSHQQAAAIAMMDPEDVLLYFSYSGATVEMMSNVKLAKSQGNITILVTQFPKAPGSLLADIILQCGAKESPLQSGSICGKMAYLYILDVLMAEYTRQDLSQSMACKRRIADALADKHL